MLELLVDGYHFFERYGPWGLLLLLVTTVLKNRKLKRYINAHLPEALRSSGDSDICEIKRDVKEIKRHLGLEEGECASTLEPYKANIPTNLSTQSQTGRSIVQFIIKYMNIRRKKSMSFLSNLNSKKLLAFVVLVLINGLNQTLGLNWDHDTILNITQGGSIYIVVQGVIDVVKAYMTKYEKTSNTTNSNFSNIDQTGE